MYHRCLSLTKNLLKKPSVIHYSINGSNPKSLAVYDGLFRDFSSLKTPDGLEKVDFSEFKTLIEDKNVVIIDVREPSELVEHGTLPRSINIPLGELETVLKNMPDEQFHKTYGHKKPEQETPIVFSCMKGLRSAKAQLAAFRIGYKKVKNYTGGWTEWVEKNPK